MSDVVEVAVVIIKNSHNQILITKRNQNQVLANHWEFPGGKVEAGEDNKRAGVREVWEEVKLELSYNDMFNYETATIESETQTINITYYLTTKYTGQPCLTDQLDLKWVGIGELSDYKFPAANSKVIAKLQREERVYNQYLAMSSDNYDGATLVYNHRDADGAKHKVITELVDNLNKCHSFIFVVAFITESGVSMLLPTLAMLADKAICGTIYTGDYLMFTEPKALRRLQQFTNITVKLIRNTPFHAKGYLFNIDNNWTSIIGSSNLTGSALTVTNEWNLKFVGTKNDLAHKAIFQQIELFDDLATTDIESYEFDYNQKQVETKLKHELYTAHLSQTNQVVTIDPNPMQTEALAGLNALRTDNKDKGLVISSTGTGKTILSALDVKQVNPKTLLFVVHRETIAKASLETYKKLIPNKKYGLYTGNQKDISADYLFATIQSLVNNLDELDPNQFEYIVIDEVHHTGAKSYQSLLSKLTPNFLLGITATPERSDGFDIFEMFDYNIGFEYRLDRAMSDNLLAPFHYFGVSDLIIDDVSVDEQTTINHLTADARVMHIIEKTQLYGYHGDTLHGLMFVSSASEAKLLSEKLNEFGMRTKHLTSEDNQAVREQAICDLELGRIDYIITVDIFNEGIDIPVVNQVVLLRPTQSAIVYVQQLGRGLRKAEGKDYVTIIDFIGNYKNNYLIPIAISNHHSYNKDVLKKDVIINSTDYLEGESIIQFEQVVQDKLIKQITNTKISTFSKIKHDYDYLKRKYNKIPTLVDFKREGLIDPSQIIKTNNYNLIKAKIENINYDFNQTEQLYLEYIYKFVMPCKRSAELDVLEHVIEQGVIEPTDEVMINACQHLAKTVFTKISDQYKYPAFFKQVTVNHYQVTKQFATALSNQLFKAEVVDALAVAKLNGTSSYNTLVIGNTYTRKEAYKLLLKDFNNGYQVSGYTVFDDMAIMFITLDDSNSFTEYTNELLADNLITWYSKANRKQVDKAGNLTQEGILANNQVPIHILSKRTSSEEFYYLGVATTKETKLVQINNKEHIEYTYQLDNKLDNNLFKYLTYKER